MSPFIVMMMCIFTACCGYAQDTQQATPVLESEIAPDLAFDRYVDLDLIGKAVFAGDADLLTDTALQLASAERTLMRSHKSGITSEALLTASFNLAKDNRDSAVLERLAKIAEVQNNKNLAVKVFDAQKLASEPVAGSAELMVSVKEMSPEDYAAFHKCISAIQVAKVTGDATWLQDWESKYGCKSDDSKHYVYLKELIAKTLAEIPRAEGVDRSVLSKLAEESRGTELGEQYKPGENRPGEWNRPGDNKPGDNKPGDNKPGEWNRPGDNRPGDNRPGDNRPGEWNRPGDNRPSHWNNWQHNCPFCKGLGSTEFRCGSCNGSGRRHFGWLTYRCSRCGGDGRMSNQCRHCKGTGRMTR